MQPISHIGQTNEWHLLKICIVYHSSSGTFAPNNNVQHKYATADKLKKTNILTIYRHTYNEHILKYTICDTCFYPMDFYLSFFY